MLSILNQPLTSVLFILDQSNGSKIRTVSCLFAPQGGQHQYSEQPPVKDGTIRQQPGEPGGGEDTGLPGGETES